MPYLTVWVPDSALYELNQQASFSSRHRNRYGSFSAETEAAAKAAEAATEAATEAPKKAPKMFDESTLKRIQEAELRAGGGYAARNKARGINQAMDVAMEQNALKRQLLRAQYLGQNIGTTIGRNKVKSGLAAAAALGAGAYGLSRRRKKRGPGRPPEYE
jgi:hypothetical protein